MLDQVPLLITPGVSVSIAGYLTQNPIASAGIGQCQSGAQLRFRQIRKWKWHQDYRARCRCDQAASSSGRFQSSASAASARSAVSEMLAGSSSRIVTSARLADGKLTLSRKRTWPCSSMTASIVFIMQLLLLHSTTRAHLCIAVADHFRTDLAKTSHAPVAAAFSSALHGLPASRPISASRALILAIGSFNSDSTV